MEGHGSLIAIEHSNPAQILPELRLNPNLDDIILKQDPIVLADKLVDVVSGGRGGGGGGGGGAGGGVRGVAVGGDGGGAVEVAQHVHQHACDNVNIEISLLMRTFFAIGQFAVRKNVIQGGSERVPH